MKKIFVLILCFGFGIIYPQSLGFIEDVSRPLSLGVSDDHVYVLEESSIKVFRMKDLSLSATIGREGEGPGEIKKTPFYRNSMKIIGDRIFVDSVDKILFFSLQGKLQIEMKKRAFLMTRMMPVGENFVAKGLDRTDGRKEFIVISLYNRQMNKVKELIRQISPIQPTTGQMIPDSVYFTVIGNRIYIDDSPRGFHLLVFDENGKELSPISRKVNRREVSSDDKERIMDEYKNDPLVKRIGFENLKKSVSFIFPEYFPPILGLESGNKYLVVKTPHIKQGEEIFYLLDDHGTLLREISLPQYQSDSGLDKNNAIDEQLIGIHKKILYTLRENAEEEQWELFRFQL